MQGESEVAGKANVLIFPGTLSHHQCQLNSIFRIASATCWLIEV
jgi:phosphotransacetylase